MASFWQCSALALMAFAGSPALALPTFDPTRVEIPRETRTHTAGTLQRNGNCLTIKTFGQVEGVLAAPIWPNGTRLDGRFVRLPNGAPVPVGRRIGLRGRFVEPDEVELARLTGRCKGRPLLVEDASQLFAWNSTEELVADSDAVMVVKVLAIDSRDPREDGMLTSINATVERTLKPGGHKPGQRLRLRLSSGQDANGRWLTSTHDPIYGPMGGLKRRLAGERLLLFVNQDFYREQARVRGGRALPGFTGGSFFYRLEGERIVNDGDSPMVPTLAELRRLTARAR